MSERERRVARGGHAEAVPDAAQPDQGQRRAARGVRAGSEDRDPGGVRRRTGAADERRHHPRQLEQQAGDQTSHQVRRVRAAPAVSEVARASRPPVGVSDARADQSTTDARAPRSPGTPVAARPRAGSTAARRTPSPAPTDPAPSARSRTGSTPRSRRRPDGPTSRAAAVSRSIPQPASASASSSATRASTAPSVTVPTTETTASSGTARGAVPPRPTRGIGEGLVRDEDEVARQRVARRGPAGARAATTARNSGQSPTRSRLRRRAAGAGVVRGGGSVAVTHASSDHPYPGRQPA